MKNQKFFLIFLVVCLTHSSGGAKIVVVYPICSKSHILAVMPAVEELGKRGHQVTVFSPFKGIAKNVPNSREVFLPVIAKMLDEAQIDWFAMQKQGPTQVFSMLPFIKDVGMLGGDYIFKHHEFLDIVNKRDVDLFIVDGMFNEFLYPVFDLIGVPFVTHSSSSVFPVVLQAMGAPIDYAAVPTGLVEFDDHMTFFQRLMNIIPNEIFNVVRTHYIIKDQDKLVQSHFPNARPIAEVEGEVSICIVNSNPMTNWPRSLPPTIVPVGALHTRPAEPLPKVRKLFKCCKPKVPNLNISIVHRN